MLENCKIIKTKRKSRLIAEREIIDFDQLYDSIVDQISDVINNSKNYKEEFQIIYNKRQSIKVKSANVIKIPKMMIENRIQLMNQVQEKFEYEDYDCVHLEKKSGDISGLIISWSDFEDIEPFDFKENIENQFEIIDIDNLDENDISTKMS